MNRIVVVEDLARFGRGRGPRRHADLPVVQRVTGNLPLAAAAGGIADHARRVEAGDRALQTAGQVLGPVDCRAKVFTTRHHVVQVNVVRLDEQAGKFLVGIVQAVEPVVYPADEHGLVSHSHTGGRQCFHRTRRPCRDLAVGVEVRVQRNLLHPFAAKLANLPQCLHPFGVTGEFHRHDRQPLGRKADPPHGRDLKQRGADLPYLVWSQQQRVPAGDDDVLQLRLAADVVERGVPLSGLRTVGGFTLHRRAAANHPAARAKGAINRTECDRQKQGLVRVTMCQVRCRLVAVLGQRVVHHMRMIRHELRAKRQKLAAHRIVLHVAPMNTRKNVRGETHVHRRLEQASLNVGDQRRLGQFPQRLLYTLNGCHRVALLPAEVSKSLRIDIAPHGNRPPKLRAIESVRQRPAATRLGAGRFVWCNGCLFNHQGACFFSSGRSPSIARLIHFTSQFAGCPQRLVFEVTLISEMTICLSIALHMS